MGRIANNLPSYIQDTASHQAAGISVFIIIRASRLSMSLMNAFTIPIWEMRRAKKALTRHWAYTLRGMDKEAQQDD